MLQYAPRCAILGTCFLLDHPSLRKKCPNCWRGKPSLVLDLCSGKFPIFQYLPPHEHTSVKTKMLFLGRLFCFSALSVWNFVVDALLSSGIAACLLLLVNFLPHIFLVDLSQTSRLDLRPTLYLSPHPGLPQKSPPSSPRSLMPKSKSASPTISSSLPRGTPNRIRPFEKPAVGRAFFRV